MINTIVFTKGLRRVVFVILSDVGGLVGNLFGPAGNGSFPACEGKALTGWDRLQPARHRKPLAPELNAQRVVTPDTL
mgnify:CR=1 FL=1